MSSVLAQEQGTAASSGKALNLVPQKAMVGVESPIISEEYVLMPGDRVLVIVNAGITYSYESWITYEGKTVINLPRSLALKKGIGTVDAVRLSGLTLKQAQDTLSTVFRKYLRSPKVKLTLIGLRSGIIFVTGEVQHPGAYNASPVERVSQVIAKAGGLSPLGSRAHINIIRSNRLHAIADIEQFEAKGDLAANPFIRSGDVIYVPMVEGIVTVKGALFGRGPTRLRTSALTTEKERVSEGIYELTLGERVSSLVRKAGGITPWADIANCYIERIVIGGNGARKRIPVNLQAIIFENDSSSDIEMMNSDILVVPPVNTLVYVEGEVVNPGAFLYTPNLHASDYIGQSGGPTHYANIHAAHIQRKDKRISVKTDPVVEPGDKILIPRIAIKWWQDYLQIISAVGVPIALSLISIQAYK